jgi:hypothetical protein
LVTRCLADRDDELSLCPWCTPGENIVSGLDSGKVEFARIDARRQLSRLRKLRCLMHDLAMVTTSLTGEERMKRENARVCRALEGQRRKRMRPPTEATHDVAEAPDRCEGCVEDRTTIGVVDHIESATAGMPRNIVCDRRGREVDRSCAEAADEFGPRVLINSEHVRAE